jgi:arylamine N-acetyltransferase
VGQLVVVRKDEDSIRSLIDRRLTVTRPDRSEQERDVGDDELAAVLRETFRVPVSDEEVMRLTFATRAPG